MSSTAKDMWRQQRARWAQHRFYGCCSLCSHDWRGHHPTRGCVECAEEQYTDRPEALPALCPQPAPGWTIWSSSTSTTPTTAL